MRLFIYYWNRSRHRGAQIKIDTVTETVSDTEVEWTCQPTNSSTKPLPPRTPFRDHLQLGLVVCFVAKPKKVNNRKHFTLISDARKWAPNGWWLWWWRGRARGSGRGCCGSLPRYLTIKVTAISLIMLYELSSFAFLLCWKPHFGQEIEGGE